MKAWTISEPGSINVLDLVETKAPIAKEGDLLIDVKASSVNRKDILTRENKTLKEPYPVLGIEISGLVIENNSNNSDFKKGSRVCGIVNNGGYAEQALIPASQAVLIPDNLSFVEAAGICEVFLTAYQTIYWQGKLKGKETILIHAGASGVGTAAIQLAKTLSDAKIIVTAGSKEKLEICKDLGANIAINYKEEDFSTVIENETEGKGVDVILDFIGGDYFHQNIKSLAVDGRLVVIGLLGGSRVEQVDLSTLLSKRISIEGTLLSTRSKEYKAELVKAFTKDCFKKFKEGSLRPIIDQTFAFEHLPKAHQMMEDNKNVGKIILDHSK